MLSSGGHPGCQLAGHWTAHWYTMPDRRPGWAPGVSGRTRRHGFAGLGSPLRLLSSFRRIRIFFEITSFFSLTYYQIAYRPFFFQSVKKARDIASATSLGQTMFVTVGWGRFRFRRFFPFRFQRSGPRRTDPPPCR